MPYSPGCLQGLTLSSNSLIIPAKHFGLGFESVCDGGCFCGAEAGWRVRGRAPAGAGSPPGSAAQGSRAPLKSCFASRAIFEAGNASVTNASAFSHTFHVTQDCAQSQDSLPRTLKLPVSLPSWLFFAFLSRGSRVGSLCCPDRCLGNCLEWLLSKKLPSSGDSRPF